MAWNLFRRVSRGVLLHSLVGILAGLACSALIGSLQAVTSWRLQHPIWVVALPVVGFFSAWLYDRYGKSVSSGHALVFEEIHDPKTVIPFRMTPLIFFGTLLTHLGGGSAGREGTAVQMGSSLADQLSRFFIVTPRERRRLLMAGLSAAFGATLGAPWAGGIFGMEVIQRGKIDMEAAFECFWSSWMGYETVRWLAPIAGIPLSEYPPLDTILYDLRTIAVVLAFGLACGGCAWAFSRTTHILELLWEAYVPYEPLRPFFAGLVLAAFYLWEGSHRYEGLGISVIQEAFRAPVDTLTPFWKFIASAVTVASGFKGGEFIPLVFVGSTLGSAVSTYLHVDTALLASLGFAAVFAGAANVPVTGTLLLMEIFGVRIGAYALVVCFASYYASGKGGIYRGQK